MLRGEIPWPRGERGGRGGATMPTDELELASDELCGCTCRWQVESFHPVGEPSVPGDVPDE